MSVFVTKALQQVWCSPEMDYQRIFSPGRLTRPGGVLRSIPVLFSHVSLPTVGGRYHVFQLGNRTLTEMGIRMDIDDDWVSILDIINEMKMQLDVYTDVGTLIPAKDVFICIIERTNMLVAVRDRGDLFGERTEDIYLRSYSNAWLDSSEARDLNASTFAISTFVASASMAADLVNLYQQYVDRAGEIRVTKNGKVSVLGGVGQIEVGQHIDLFYDGAVQRSLSMPVSGLKIFNSSLDDTAKYIIHPSKLLTGADQINYHDDVDFYVVTGEGVNKRGLFLHSNAKENQRMLTHNDYAIRVSHVSSIAHALGVTPEECTVEMLIRRGRSDRELSFERHFIHELYKLPDEDIIDILAEEKASIEYWTAECLENSYYTKLMRSGVRLVTEDDALKAFGYGGCTAETMKTPVRVTTETAERPLGFRKEVLVTVTDDSTGESDIKYLGASTTIDGQGYSDAVIDLRLASSEHRRKVYHQIESFTMPSHLSFTAYRAIKENGVSTGEWVNVTYTDDYAYENGRFKWLIELPLYEVMVVPGDYSDLMVETVDYPAEKVFDLKATHSIDGSFIPTAEVRVVADKKLLTPGVDFTVRHDELVITNLSIARLTGVVVKIARIGCETDRPRVEDGFIFGNTLSRDDKYDLHGSAVRSVICADRLIPHDEQVFAESGDTNPRLVNGSPYQMTYYRGPIADVPWWKVSDLREDWDKVFPIIESYLTSRLSETVDDDLVTIPNLYALYSPFMHNVIKAMERGILNFGEPPYLDDYIVRTVKSFEYLLAFEPVISGRYDERLVSVSPHADEFIINLTEDELYILHRLNDLYLNGVMSFNQFIGVDNG